VLQVQECDANEAAQWYIARFKKKYHKLVNENQSERSIAERLSFISSVGRNQQAEQ
jgi:hypothetical protein